MKSVQKILAQIPLLETEPFLSITQLEGGNSNQSFLISTPDVKYVLRLDAEAQQIFRCPRQFEIEILELACCHGISPKPIYYDLDKGVLLYVFVEGNPLTKEQLAQPYIKQQFLQLREKITLIGKQTHHPINNQALLNQQILEPQLPSFDDLIKIQKNLKGLYTQLNNYSDEYCLCHNDLSPANLLLNKNNQLFALDWEYASNNHPLLDFAFAANNFEFEDSWLQQHYPQFLTHVAINFYEIRQLAWFIEAVWYAKRQQHNPHRLWESQLERAISKL